MNVTFMNDEYKGTRLLKVDDARIVFRNFSGRADQFNREGDRSFHVVISEHEIAEAMQNDTNEYGAGWNVKIKPPREEGDEPFMHMAVKVKYNDRGGRVTGPDVKIIEGDISRPLYAETIGMLDDIDIDHVDLYIRAYDGEGRFGPFRTAYLQAMRVYMRRSLFND